jgi:hypothetical protein
VADRHDVDRVAVGIGGEHRLRRDVAAGAAFVLDHHLLAPHLAETTGDDAGRIVDGAARRERHHEAHEAAWKCLGARNSHQRGRRQRGTAHRDKAAAEHGGFLL